jgi:hypothetical protein
MANPVVNQGTALPPNNAGYTSLAGTPNDYLIRLVVVGDDTLSKDGSKVTFEANMPERYHIGMTSNWSSPFASKDAATALGGSKGAIVEAGLNAAGATSKNKASSIQIWESSSGISMNVDLIFMAIKNTAQDVREKHRMLMKLAAPSEMMGGVMLRQPGPSAADAALGFFGKTSRKISLHMGRNLYLDNVIIKGVSADMTSLCDINGHPVSMTINVDIETFYTCFTVQDIDKMFDYLG